jgi:hypothetical protein
VKFVMVEAIATPPAGGYLLGTLLLAPSAGMIANWLSAQDRGEWQ